MPGAASVSDVPYCMGEDCTSLHNLLCMPVAATARSRPVWAVPKRLYLSFNHYLNPLLQYVFSPSFLPFVILHVSHPLIAESAKVLVALCTLLASGVVLVCCDCQLTARHASWPGSQEGQECQSHQLGCACDSQGCSSMWYLY